MRGSAQDSGTLGHAPAGWQHTVVLAQDESSALYRQMEAVKRAHRFYDKQGQPKQNEAVLSCVQSSSSELCLLQVRLLHNQLSADQPIAPELASTLREKIRQMGAELGERVLTDLRCSELGDTMLSPGSLEYQCTIQAPRNPGEFFVEGTLADNLFQSIRSDRPIVEQLRRAKGNLTCRSASYAPVAVCWARAWSQGALGDRVTELPIRDSLGVSQLLFRAYTDLASGLGAGTVGLPVRLPEQLVANIECQVDQKRWKASFQLRAFCKGRLANQSRLSGVYQSVPTLQVGQSTLSAFLLNR